jgi:hypothetical protein
VSWAVLCFDVRMMEATRLVWFPKNEPPSPPPQKKHFPCLARDSIGMKQQCKTLSPQTKFGIQPVAAKPDVILPCLFLACWCADSLIDNLSVSEMLLYTAELTHPVSVPLADKQAAVDRVIDCLSLQDCRNTIIGNQLRKGVSGEQAHVCQGERGSGGGACVCALNISERSGFCTE